MKKHWRTIVVFVVVFVVPHPVYRLRGVSLVGMVCKLGQVGTSHLWGWDTCAAILALIVVSLVISVYVSKRLGSSSEN